MELLTQELRDRLLQNGKLRAQFAEDDRTEPDLPSGREAFHAGCRMHLAAQ